MQKEHNMESIIYVGMDVHKDNYSICCYKASEDRFYYEKSILAESKRVIKYLQSVKKEFGEDTIFVCGYEAGPTGFGLYRDLQNAGYSCVVMAPTSLKHPASHKVKNDKVDARFLAKTLFTKDYSSVHVTTEHEESIKEFCRMRLNLKTALKKARQVLAAFLLRQDKKYTDGDTWTLRHRAWLKQLHFDEEYLNEVFNEYMISINSYEARLQAIERRLEEISQDKSIKESVDKLVCFCGIDTVSAVTIVSKIGDFKRFSKAYHFSNYLGLTCGENSSGQKEQHLGITKCGDKELRRIITESAKSIKRSNLKGEKSRRLLDRQKNKDPLVIAYADKCRLRLSGKIIHLEMRGKPANVATTAAARELACFIWGMMTNNIA